MGSSLYGTNFESDWKDEVEVSLTLCKGFTVLKCLSITRSWSYETQFKGRSKDLVRFLFYSLPEIINNSFLVTSGGDKENTSLS